MTEQMFVKRGRNIMLASDRGDEIPSIPPGFYVVNYNPMAGGFFLTETEGFALPKSLYGTTLPRADMILNTFADRANKTTGVLLSGKKGSGKTLLAKVTCAKAAAMGAPVLIMQQPFAGPEFENFLNSLQQPLVVFIDEFEKKYDDEEKQNQLLTLLDGINQGSKMYILTSNSADVSQYLLNRPSRIFYHIPFNKLEEDVLIGYCSDNLQNPKKFPLIKALWSLSKDMSFDILQSVVEEQNRYPEKPFLALLDDMNVSLDGQLMRLYRMKRATHNGERMQFTEGQRAHVHLVYFQEGDNKVSVSTNLDLETQIKLTEVMKKGDFYFYNDELVADVKAGKAVDEDDFVPEFNFVLRYEEGSTFMTTERLTFRRNFGPHEFVFEFESEKQDATFAAISRVFEGLEEQ